MKPVETNLNLTERFEVVNENRMAVQPHCSNLERRRQIKSVAQAGDSRKHSAGWKRRGLAPISGNKQRRPQFRAPFQEPNDMPELSLIEIAPRFVSVP